MRRLLKEVKWEAKDKLLLQYEPAFLMAMSFCRPGRRISELPESTSSKGRPSPPESLIGSEELIPSLQSSVGEY